MGEPQVNYKDKLMSCLQKNSNQEFFPIFWNLKNDSIRLNFVYENLEYYEILKDAFNADCNTKDDERAKECLLYGDMYGNSGNYRIYLASRTQCVAFAKSKEMLTKAYAARSEALFALDLHEESITDIERAFINGQLENLRSEALFALDLHEESITDIEINGQLENLRSQLIERRNKSLELLKTKMDIKPYENPPNTEECVDLAERRRGESRDFVVATRDIQIGGLIGMERPVTGGIARNHNHFYCHHCFSLCYNPIPCDTCTQFLSCSEICKQYAFLKYHHQECPILYSLNKLMQDNFGRWIPLRILFTQEKRAVSKIIENSHMAYNYETFFEMTIVGAVVYHLVKKYTDVFSGPEGEAAEAHFKKFIIKYLLFCQNRLTDISAIACYHKMTNDNSPFLKNETIAHGVYTFRNMFRHSCCPNVHIYFCGTTMVFRAIRTIKKGEECFVSYGPRYASHKLKERREKLFSSYGFDCSCRACQQNWPQFDLVEANKNLLFCHSDKQLANDLLFFIVDMVKVEIKIAEMKVKEFEHKEPCADLNQYSKKLISYCSALGNKRVL